MHVRDLGTRNGTRVDGRRVPAEGGANIEQGELIVGRTRLHVRTRHTRIGQERVFRRDFVRRHRTPLAVAGVAACVGYAGLPPVARCAGVAVARASRRRLLVGLACSHLDRPLGAHVEAQQGPLGSARAPRRSRRSAWLSAPGVTGWPACWLSPHSGPRSPRSASPSSARRPSRRCTCICARPRLRAPHFARARRRRDARDHAPSRGSSRSAWTPTTSTASTRPGRAARRRARRAEPRHRRLPGGRRQAAARIRPGAPEIACSTRRSPTRETEMGECT